MRENKDTYFLRFARIIATQGTCVRRKVGAVAVNARGFVIATGYNGVPSGLPHCNEGYRCPGSVAASGTNLDQCYAIHAEVNLLAQCRDVWEINIIYTTVPPCFNCTKALLASGTQRIVFSEEYPHPEARTLWMSAGRQWQKLNQQSTESPVTDIERFVTESNLIEGITRPPSVEEIDATANFFETPVVSVKELENLVHVFAPGHVLRDRSGFNVRVGQHIPIPGGKAVRRYLEDILDNMRLLQNPYLTHCAYQTLHPFTDGNGRSGRALWAWNMMQLGRSPFKLSFLHQFYYQTLANSDGRKKEIL